MELRPGVVGQSMAKLSDEELVRVLTANAADYVPDALAAAQREAEKRGGFAALRGQADQRERANKERARERTLELAEVRRGYPVWLHVLGVAERWWATYGVLAIMWVLSRYSGAFRESPLSGLVGLLVLALGFAVQATVWGALTYRKTLNEIRLVACAQCGKTVRVNLRILRDSTTPAAADALPCPACGKPTGARLGELIRQAELGPDGNS